MLAPSVMSPLFALVSMDADREDIELAMREAVVTPDSYLNEIASHLIVAGGKRLRPVLAVAAAQVLGGPSSYDVVRGGVSCELVHLGSLYHDDVMDEADTRRGVETVNAKWGNLQAILAGDFLLARASEIAASLGTEVAGLLARTIGWLCEGQIEELRHTYDIARAEGSYFASIHGKTARCTARPPASAASSPATIASSSTPSRSTATPTAPCSRSSTTSWTSPPPTSSSASRPATT